MLRNLGIIGLPIYTSVLTTNFKLYDTKKTLCSLAQEIEEQRKAIIREYGVMNKEKEIIEVPLEKISDASQKMNELFNLT